MRILSVLMGEAYINVALLLKEKPPRLSVYLPISKHFTKYSLDSQTKDQALPMHILNKEINKLRFVSHQQQYTDF